MAKITNNTQSDLIVAGNRLQAGGEMEFEGDIPESIKILANKGALNVEGADTALRSKNLVVKDVKNPKSTETVVQTDTTSTPKTEDARLVEVILALPEESFMADGRPEVKAINENLPEGINNVTAADRDRLWEIAQKQKARES